MQSDHVQPGVDLGGSAWETGGSRRVRPQASSTSCGGRCATQTANALRQTKEDRNFGLRYQTVALGYSKTRG